VEPPTRPSVLLGLTVAAQLVTFSPLAAQSRDSEIRGWHLGGLRSGFCVQLLLDPASEVLHDLPTGYTPVPASRAGNLHRSLRDVVEGQSEFASWTPSRLCFNALDTIRTSEFTLGDRSGRHPQLLAIWLVTAAGPDGAPRDVALQLFVNSQRLIRPGRLVGQLVQQARLRVGKVPQEDENGVPSSDDRFEVKLGKTTITWDGGLARDSVPVRTPLEMTWTAMSTRGALVKGRLSLSPTVSRAMVGSLKVDGKDEFAKALRSSPTRFAGPAYRGGGGMISFEH
jgi:hypothetical protein